MRILLLAVGFTALVFYNSVASELSDEFAKCAALDNTLTRGECYDALAKSQGLNTVTEVTQGYGKWRLETDTSQFDDSRTVYLTLDADKKIQISPHDSVLPTMFLRCRENTTAAFVNYDHFLGSDDIRVEYRIDKLPSIKDTWFISSDHNAAGLWRGMSAIPFIRRLVDKNQLVIRLTPYSQSPAVVSFDISGLREPLSELAKTCNWAIDIKSNAAHVSESDTSSMSFEEQMTLTLNMQSDEVSALAEVAASQFRKCWIVPAGAKNAENITIAISVDMNPDATVRNSTVVDTNRGMADSYFRAVSESALRATKNSRCQPLPLPLDQYDLWRSITVNFESEDMH